MNRQSWIALLFVGVVGFSPVLRAQEAEPAKPAPAEVKPAETTPAVVEEKSALELLPATLVNAKGEEVSKDSLKGKIVGLYFSAHWCGPCRAFTPQLVAFRDAHADEFEVVFVSSDKNAEAMKDYMAGAKMQWPAVPFGDPAAKAIKQHFAIRGIPTLVILGADGKVISRNGRGDIGRLKDGALAEWKK